MVSTKSTLAKLHVMQDANAVNKGPGKAVAVNEAEILDNGAGGNNKITQARETMVVGLPGPGCAFGGHLDVWIRCHGGRYSKTG